MSDAQAVANVLARNLFNTDDTSLMTTRQLDDYNAIIIAITAALDAREREVWEKVIEQLGTGEMNWLEFDSWCRRQGGGG